MLFTIISIAVIFAINVTSRRARCRVNRRLPQNTITANLSNFTHISISPAQPPSLSAAPFFYMLSPNYSLADKRNGP